MLIQRIDITGIDVLITKYQTKLHSYLCTEWGLDTLSASDWLCYDRCYRNQTKNGFIPEVYNGKDYKEVLLNDNTKVLSFFGIGNQITQENEQMTANVHLIMFVNLQKLFAGRHDETARQKVIQFASKGDYGFRFDSVQIGIDTVLSEYNGSKLTYKDLQPFHIFRLNFTINYNLNKHIC